MIFKTAQSQNFASFVSDLIKPLHSVWSTHLDMTYNPLHQEFPWPINCFTLTVFCFNFFVSLLRMPDPLLTCDWRRIRPREKWGMHDIVLVEKTRWCTSKTQHEAFIKQQGIIRESLGFPLMSSQKKVTMEPYESQINWPSCEWSCYWIENAQNRALLMSGWALGACLVILYLLCSFDLECSTVWL